jgi:hypothetical protein
MLHFSPKGKRLFEQMGAVALEFEDALLQQVSPEEIAVLDAVLAKLKAAAEAYQAQNAAPRGRKAREPSTDTPPSLPRSRAGARRPQ